MKTYSLMQKILYCDVAVCKLKFILFTFFYHVNLIYVFLGNYLWTKFVFSSFMNHIFSSKHCRNRNLKVARNTLLLTIPQRSTPVQGWTKLLLERGSATQLHDLHVCGLSSQSKAVESVSPLFPVWLSYSTLNFIASIDNIQICKHLFNELEGEVRTTQRETV